jgi:hypothetical protein
MNHRLAGFGIRVKELVVASLVAKADVSHPFVERLTNVRVAETVVTSESHGNP